MLCNICWMNENEISRLSFNCALEVHKLLGPGLLESAYSDCLFYELFKSGSKVEKQRAMPLVYKEVQLDIGYRPDLIVADKLIIEVTSVEALNDVHFAQVLTYLTLPGCKLGLLINFNVKLLKSGVRRVINGIV